MGIIAWKLHLLKTRIIQISDYWKEIPSNHQVSPCSNPTSAHPTILGVSEFLFSAGNFLAELQSAQFCFRRFRQLLQQQNRRAPVEVAWYTFDLWKWSTQAFANSRFYNCWIRSTMASGFILIMLAMYFSRESELTTRCNIQLSSRQISLLSERWRQSIGFKQKSIKMPLLGN